MLPKKKKKKKKDQNTYKVRIGRAVALERSFEAIIE
jgi:hypothetical protein